MKKLIYTKPLQTGRGLKFSIPSIPLKFSIALFTLYFLQILSVSYQRPSNRLRIWLKSMSVTVGTTCASS